MEDSHAKKVWDRVSFRNQDGESGSQRLDGELRAETPQAGGRSGP